MEIAMTADIFLFPDHEAMSLRGASIVTVLAENAIASNQRFRIALSGGVTPLRMFGLLCTAYKKVIRWDLTDIFWVDERCVPPDHEESNYGRVYEALLSGLDIPETNIHRMKGEMQPSEGAMEYEEELRKFFGAGGFPVFDLVVLGIGSDGHIASLFPGSSALSEQDRLAIPVHAEHLRSNRITLTLPVLNNAAHILFLVSGREKAGVLKEVIEGGEQRLKYPAGLIRPVHGSMTWLIDRDAGSMLQRHGERI
jgi:6-phosphogluconolactonase